MAVSNGNMNAHKKKTKAAKKKRYSMAIQGVDSRSRSQITFARLTKQVLTILHFTARTTEDGVQYMAISDALTLFVCVYEI